MRDSGKRAAGEMRRMTQAIAVAFAAAVAVIGTAAAETAIERGRYLVTTVGACGNCHAPRAANGMPAKDKELAGGFEFDERMLGHIVVSNITPDRETGIGDWTEAQIVTALREGKRPDGTIIGPPMPIPAYRRLSDSDARAIAAYLKSLKPVRHAVAKSQLKIPLPAAYGPPVTQIAEPDRADKVAYGAYLAGPVGHCVLCHTPPGGGAPFDMSRAWQGGRELPDFDKPGAFTVSRNITSDPDHGIGKWSDAEIKKAIVAGVRPDGTRLARTMPFEAYARMTPDDLDAIVVFLRSLKPAPRQ
jgi:mono/diheme cytochrome c family protein